jgi:ribosomal protein S15P/S13E
MELFKKDEKVVTLENIKKVASRRGRRDGKAEKPSLSWGVNSVPFISQALAQFSAEAERRIAKTRDKLNARVYESLERDEQITLLSSQIHSMEKHLEEADAREKHFKNELDGYKEENPVGRFARTKLIGDVVYPIVLGVLAIGEIFVTLPALIQLFGSTKWESTVIGIAVGILPVAGAHVIGIFLKSRLDRQRPQESWLKNFYLAIFSLIVIAIISLGVLRAGITLGNLQDFQIIGTGHTKQYLMFFFIGLQLAFFSVATGLSFMHYSPSAEAHKHAKRENKKLKAEEKALKKSLLSFKAKGSISSDEVDAQIRSLTSEIEILQKEYEVAVSIYREANIHSRRDEIDGAHPSLQAPSMVVNLDKFQDVYNSIKNVPARSVSGAN